MKEKFARPRASARANAQRAICLSAKLQGAVEVVDDCSPDIMCNKVLRHGAYIIYVYVYISWQKY